MVASEARCVTVPWPSVPSRPAEQISEQWGDRLSTGIGSGEVLEKHLASGVRVGCLSPVTKPYLLLGFQAAPSPLQQTSTTTLGRLLCCSPARGHKTECASCSLLLTKCKNHMYAPAQVHERCLPFINKKKLKKLKVTILSSRNGWKLYFFPLHRKKTSENLVLLYDYINTHNGNGSCSSLHDQSLQSCRGGNANCGSNGPCSQPTWPS